MRLLSAHHSRTLAQSIQSLTKPLLTSAVLIFGISNMTVAADIPSIYQEACAACHDTGALNAPKTGDKARWDALKRQKGMPALVNAVKTGMPQMPAGGLCSSCSDKDYLALIEYMSK